MEITVEIHEIKLKVFRKYYNRLKDCFDLCKEVVAVHLYAKGLISKEIRDCKESSTMLATLENVLTLNKSAWDVLVNEVMAEPPLVCLADLLTQELATLQQQEVEKKRVHQLPDVNFERFGGTPDCATDLDDFSTAVLHPTSLAFNSESKCPSLDSGTWTSDKSGFPNEYFTLDPSITTIDEDSTKPTNDSGIQEVLNNDPSESETIDDNNTVADYPFTSSTHPPPVLSRPEAAQSRTSRSEMVSPNTKTDTPTQCSTPAKKSSAQYQQRAATQNDLRMKFDHLRSENTELKQQLLNMREENETLRTDIELVNGKREDESKLLESKMKQLSVDNELLSKQVGEKRQLESENRKLSQEVKQYRQILDRYKSEMTRLKQCLAIAERNARVQSVNIDKLREEVVEQKLAFEEYKKIQYEQWLQSGKCALKLHEDDDFESSNDFESSDQPSPS